MEVWVLELGVWGLLVFWSGREVLVDFWVFLSRRFGFMFFGFFFIRCCLDGLGFFWWVVWVLCVWS